MMLQLGPRWSRKELRTFYILLKAHGPQWDKLEERLPQRTSEMVRALFDMHRGYLSLPEASVEGFCTIMMDHYEMQDKQTRLLANDRTNNDNNVIKQEPSDEPVRNKKKRRLEKLLATDQKLGSFQFPSPYPNSAVNKRVQRNTRKSAAPRKARAWFSQDLDVPKATGGMILRGQKRFNLPSSHWFYSFVDADFFHHNEFLECLNNMGLGRITTAARPIWSSVRASMGRPRRLSPLFFTQEKEKLNAYRVLKRQLDPTKWTTDETWPYHCKTPLRPGIPLIVWVESEQRFQFATLAAVSASGKSTCQVVYRETRPPFHAAECNLDNIMVLDFSPCPSRQSESCLITPKLPLSTLLRRETRLLSTLSPPKPLDPSGDRSREQKVRVIVAVKALLHRKERILSAMATIREQYANCATVWTTPTALATDMAWTTSPDHRVQVQKQYSWLSENLQATNEHLKAALHHLESFSTNQLLETATLDRKWSDSVDEVVRDKEMASETLTQSQLRWAIDFLAASQQKAASMVDWIVKKDKDQSNASAAAIETRVGTVLPETMQLVAHCVTLMSILHRQVANVPPVVTQKLVERVLELLRPCHETNLDLYNELYAAVDAAHTQMILQTSTSE